MYSSVLNIFVKEIKTGPRIGQYKEVPNWPVIILFSLGVIAITTALSVFFYRRWRKNNCFPIYFAGKVLWARKGSTINDACYAHNAYDDWIDMRKLNLSVQGHTILGLYTDADLSIPLNRKAKVTCPVHIYPKIKQ